jgi:hypothetical protein
MLSNILVAPSLNSLFVTGFLLLLILMIFITNYKKIINLDNYHKITMLSLITIAFGVHGLIHLGVEKEYGFNPYRLFFNI